MVWREQGRVGPQVSADAMSGRETSGNALGPHWLETGECFLSGFPGDSAGEESACDTGDAHSISGLGRAPGGGHGNSLQYSCLENPTDRGSGGLQSRVLQRVRHDLTTKQQHYITLQLYAEGRKAGLTQETASFQSQASGRN